MPRITAPTVAEHVAQQQERVFATAVRLFIENGYANVSFVDIADAVGLARNSLYRYFDSKADILARWFRAELEQRIARSTEWLDRDGEPLGVITAWADDQLDYAARGEHDLVMSMAQIEPDLAAEARRELFGDHSQLTAPLRQTLLRAGVDPGAVDATAELIGGLILSAARYESAGSSPDPVLRDRLHRAIGALVDS